ncbi:response regulator [Solimonas terrae]|uniref:Response regulator n=1 Tax=Solimonas terrae TaxID=1396819 RepID=A0A6M2BUI0_9GAMM|nr:response regulator [Solimonas terrae]NGY06034.1 response regulator [Solimonas terrae]
MERTALVVDDSKSARFALRRHLESHAFKVDTADCATDAYRIVHEQRPDLIFLDHIMPGIDGFEAMRKFKQDPETAAIPIVICSSNEGEAFISEARDQGAADVLPKPPTPEHLQRLLTSIELRERELEIEASLSAAQNGDAVDEADVLLDAPVAATPAAAGFLVEAPAVPAPAADAELQALRARVSALEQRLDSELAELRAQFARELDEAGRKALEQFAQSLLKASRPHGA